MQAIDRKDVHKVIVVSKTHLDIGFTDYAQAVLDRYVKDYIPKAVALANALNAPGNNRFVWTTGSYLIRYALEHSTPENARRLREAICAGCVRYHALPLTTHTELMSAALFRYGISIAKKLDAEFGCHTRAAKMTDVPGHTQTIVPLMAEAGIRYLHIGVNASSRVPQTPPVFRWRYRGKELAVSYSGDYATPLILPNGAALEMLHTHDNFGPPTEEEVNRFYAGMRKRYPNAELVAGTLDDFAREIETVWDELPVVEEEIGDTWIHGVASDPVKTSDFKRLLSLADRWLEEGALIKDTPAYESFFENLLLVAEHTWGMDVKKYLLDFTNWEKRDFLNALQRDATSYALYGEHNHAVFEGMKKELAQYRGENQHSSYSAFVKSHSEQRAYLIGAVEALPPELRLRARNELHYSYPQTVDMGPFVPGGTVLINGWHAVFDENGTLIRLRNEKRHLDHFVRIGEFLYESFDGETVSECYRSYGRDLKQNGYWAECDFGKPGLEHAKGVRNGLWKAVPCGQITERDRHTVFLRGEEEACEAYGCPREIAVSYAFDESGVGMTLYWRKKDPIRSPEAIWLGVQLNPSNPNRVRFQKLGSLMDPQDVVFGGNRKLHAIERVSIKTATEDFAIVPCDSPVVSVGGRHLYHADHRAESPENGLYFLLCNNRWGTNFPQWFGEDARFSFRMELQKIPPAVPEGAEGISPIGRRSGTD